MYLVEKELRGQFDSIEKTVAYALEQSDAIQDFFADVNSICVCGCGSSYSVAKSTAMQFAQRTGKNAMALAAGDVLVNFSSYHKIFERSALILLSRSGTTSELRRMAELCREQWPKIKIVAICAATDTPLGVMADLSLELPWAFDHAVCQTQTVSNLYLCGLTLTAIISDDTALLADIARIPQIAAAFTPNVEASIETLGQATFEKVVVLADSGMAGLAEEGSLAFKEICHVSSNFYNVLDVRHGPLITIGQNSLVIVLVSRGTHALQTELVQDIAKQAGAILILNCTEMSLSVSNATELHLPETSHDDLSALFMLYCLQLLCLKHALARGIDPDKPPGLDPWIKLNI